MINEQSVFKELDEMIKNLREEVNTRVRYKINPILDIIEKTTYLIAEQYKHINTVEDYAEKMVKLKPTQYKKISKYSNIIIEEMKESIKYDEPIARGLEVANDIVERILDVYDEEVLQVLYENGLISAINDLEQHRLTTNINVLNGYREMIDNVSRTRKYNF